MARQAQTTGSSRVFVVTEVDQPTVVAFYDWCMASVAIPDLPKRLRHGGAAIRNLLHSWPGLEVDDRHGGRGIGAALLVDVISRVARLSDAIGCRRLVVHAESQEARSFYEHLIPEFERSPTDPLHLLLSLKDISHTLRSLRL